MNETLDSGFQNVCSRYSQVKSAAGKSKSIFSCDQIPVDLKDNSSSLSRAGLGWQGCNVISRVMRRFKTCWIQVIQKSRRQKGSEKIVETRGLDPHTDEQRRASSEALSPFAVSACRTRRVQRASGSYSHIREAIGGIHTVRRLFL